MRCLIAGVTLLWTPLAFAAELGAPGEGPTVEMHGFVSQGAIKTTGNNYLLGTSKRGSVEFAEIGANFSGQLTDRLRVGFQLFASKLGSNGNFNVKADWFSLDYRWRDWLGLRAGRVKLPFGLYNDTSDIDAARVPVLLPQSVYPLADRDFLLAQTGFELYGFINLSSAGALEYRLYGGTIYIPLSGQAPGPVQVTAFNADYVAGGRLFWDTPVDGLRVGASVQALHLDVAVNYAFPMTTAETVTADVPALLWVGSLEYAAHDWLVAVEYSRWRSKVVDSSNAMLLPNMTTVSERAYSLVAYRVRRWFQPGVYYSRMIRNVDMTEGAGAAQHDLAGTLRFDINTFWLVKLEGHFMHGTGGVDPGLNGGAARDTLPNNWGVFLLKTTAYF